MRGGAVQARLQPGGNALAAWEVLLTEAKACTRCHLYGPATQTVFGEGPLDARIVFVGEQPGDQEDIAGRPFVGPGLGWPRAGRPTLTWGSGADRARSAVVSTRNVRSPATPGVGGASAPGRQTH